jgi:hypothetical protein
MEAQLKIENEKADQCSGSTPSGQALVDDLITFDDFGTKSDVKDLQGIPLITNEFWTAGQRQGHSLHEVSYRACFKPQLPRFFIDRLTTVGDRVHDPFMGRGTTLLESALASRVPSGSDINPLSRVLVEPRLAPPTLIDIEQRLSTIVLDDDPPEWPVELLAFYHPKTLAQLVNLRAYFFAREDANELDQIDTFIRMVSINRLTGHSSGFFSVYSLPPNQATSVKRQRAINAKRNQTPPLRDVKTLIVKKARALLRDVTSEDRKALAPAAGKKILVAPAWNTREIQAGEVDLVITSPPFLDIVDYQSDNWLRCWFAGIDPDAVAVSKLRKVDDWRQMVNQTLIEQQRILRTGGHICFEVGEVRNGEVELEKEVLKASVGTRLRAVAILINRQAFTKTSHLWGVKNKTGGTNTNRVVIMKRI